MLSRRHKTIAAGVASLAIASPVVAEAATPLPEIPSPATQDRGVARVFPTHPKHRSEPRIHKTYRRLYAKVKRADGEDPGRNIVKHGVRRKGEVRPARRAEVARSVRTLKKMLPGDGAAPAGWSATGAPSSRSDGKASGSSQATPALEAIAACESGSDPGSVGGGGAYRGKYQFDQSTWSAVGGSGDPAAASEAEQDSRAAQLYAQQGASAWPTCGQ